MTMDFTFHVYLHPAGLDVESMLKMIVKEMTKLNAVVNDLQTRIDKLSTDVQNATTVIAGAETLIGGIPGLIQTAVQDALSKGATADQLSALDQLSSTLENKVSELASQLATVQGGQPAPNPPTA
jgi:predicted  nucleic acid-binding Zn-ribbon protein